MLSSRLIYEKSDPPFGDISEIVERVDNFLDTLKYCEPVDNFIYLYGEMGESDLLIGREITGREEEAYHHETIRVADFEGSSSDEVDFVSRELEDLLRQIKSTKNSTQSFRIRWDISTPHDFKVYFF